MERTECVELIKKFIMEGSESMASIDITEDTFLMEVEGDTPSLMLTSLETVALLTEIESAFDIIIDFDVWFIQIKDIVDYIMDKKASN